MDIGKITPREITEEMRESYLDYAMSVIVSRALPDVRDGLKPVHRRVLYAMQQMGLTHSAKFRKCAAIVGDTLGRYHPHGDAAVYDALVRLAQDFSLRYPLVEGQGNFGSIDGDAPAAQRYTEARMSAIAEELLRDIEKDTVDFRDNYDGTRKEPIVLPSAIPNLLLNGTIGIAVGMATNIPPHNLTEVADALIYLIQKPKADVDEIMQFIKGPDFPTGGIIFDEKQIKEAYTTGNGAILMRGKAIIEEGRRKTMQIVITEIPYQVNKAELIQSVAKLVLEKRLEGIRDIRDESDKEGMRIVIELKSDAHPQKILNNLYKHTDLEKNFNLNMLALVQGIQPQVLSIKSVLEEFINHRVEVVTRRTRFDLARTKERIHILEGLKKALDHINQVIALIKRSRTREEAHRGLMKKFRLSERQTNAILDMRLQTLVGLERQKIDQELKEKRALAKRLEALLKDPRKIKKVVKDEIQQIKEKYGDERRTKVVKHSPKKFSEEDLVADEETIIVVTRGGFIKRIKPETYRVQKRGGKGLVGMETREEDFVEHLLICNTHDSLLVFTDKGKVYQIRAYEVPEGTRTSKGRSIFNILALSQEERITSILGVSKTARDGQKHIVMLTKNGIIKKVDSSVFENVRSSGLIALTLRKGDELRWARLTSGKDELILVTAKGQAIRYSERDVRSMGRQAAGVTALRLRDDDEVVGMDVVGSKNDKLLIVTQNGYGKLTELRHYRRQKRGGSGVKTITITPKTGRIVNARIIGKEEKELIVISRKGQVIRTKLAAVSTLSRTARGVRIMRLEAGDLIASVTTL